MIVDSLYITNRSIKVEKTSGAVTVSGSRAMWPTGSVNVEAV